MPHLREKIDAVPTWQRIPRWFTSEMTSQVAVILRKALAESDRRGARRPRITDLTASDVQVLSAATLQFLRTRPSRPSSWPGWVAIDSFEAGVNRWWNAEIDEPFPSDTSKRLQTLRGDIYDHLEDEQGLIVKGQGQMAVIHLSPTGEVLAAEDLAEQDETITIGRYGAGAGDATKNRLVELAAMEVTIEYFADWSSEDVSSARCGWDITFIRGSEELHAEVKGVSGRKPVILLTSNEWNTAKKDEAWRLVVVTRALIAPQVVVYDRHDAVALSKPHVFRVDLS